MIDLGTSTLMVKNFGPIREATVELRPLTVFVGPGNTGKSYLATLVYALHRLFGGAVRHPTRQEEMPKSAARVLHGWLQDMPASPGTIPITRPVYRLLHPLLREYGTLFQDEVSRCFGNHVISLIRQPRRLPAGIAIKAGSAQSIHPALNGEFVIDKRLEVTAQFPESAAFEVHDRPTVEFNDLRYAGGGGKETPVGELDADRLLRALLPVLVPAIFGVFSHRAFYLPADRAGIMRAHHVMAGTRQDFRTSSLPGASTDFLSPLVDMDAEMRHKVLGRRSRELEEQMDYLAENLEADILRGSVAQPSLKTGRPALYYHPDEWQGSLHLNRASSTVFELAPMVAYLRHIAQAGDVLIIEEPEAHLHPSDQAVLMRHIAAMVKSGIRVLMTTHSEWMMEALANLVLLSNLAEEKRTGLAGAGLALTREQVGVWLFNPKQRPKGTVVKELPLNLDTGHFDHQFDDVGIMLHNDWAETYSRIVNG